MENPGAKKKKKKWRVSTGVIKSLKCNCTRESGDCRRQRGISRRKEVGSGRTMLEFKERVLAVDKTHHLLFASHRSSWASSVKKTRRRYIHSNHKPYFSPFISSPDELVVNSRTLVRACESHCAVNNVSTSHTCFSCQMFLSRASGLEGKRNWKRFRSGCVWPSAPLEAKATARICPREKGPRLIAACRASD